jgi:hypothetical protein
MDKYAELTARGVGAYLAALTELGWFKLPHNFKPETESRLKEIQEPRFLQSSLAHLAFDAEGFATAGAYESLLAEIFEVLELPEAEFQVEDDEEIIGVHLKIGENEYEYQIQIAEHEDWLDQNFIQEFVNSVAAGEKMESRFFCLPPADQVLEFVFIPEKYYAVAVARGLIPEEMEYFMEDAEEE